MSSFDILSVAPAIFVKHRVFDPFVNRFKKSKGDHTELTQLQRMLKLSKVTLALLKPNTSGSRTLCLRNMIDATLRMSKLDILAAGILKFAIVIFMASPCSTKSDALCENY
ncbi:hypothetical protein HAX54_048105 [Datura stramonium]|uniref:Uncharacterized protein n=1 Tax=Datura stramonium TaxID=4076 RepID=A0ABS8RQC8_DATST|nr:hypothetical protein [Datura stramonium]